MQKNEGKKNGMLLSVEETLWLLKAFLQIKIHFSIFCFVFYIFANVLFSDLSILKYRFSLKVELVGQVVQSLIKLTQEKRKF